VGTVLLFTPCLEEEGATVFLPDAGFQNFSQTDLAVNF